MIDIKKAVDRFLCWPMPRDFSPDCYISFDRPNATNPHCWPVGTNLFTADQAREMFEHCLQDSLKRLESQPVPVEPVAECDALATDFNGTPWIRAIKGAVNRGDKLYSQSAIDSLQSALKRVQEERDRLKSYWLAIDNRMVVLHLGTADSFDADTCMNKILEWETTIALDPQVSRPAQELKDTHLRRAEKAESLNRRIVELLKEPSEGILAAGYPPNDERAQSWDVTEIFKAMSAELLKEATK